MATAGEGEPHPVQVLGADHRPVVDDAGPDIPRAQEEGARPVGEDRVGHRRLRLAVEVIRGGAHLGGHHQGSMPREGGEVVPGLLEGDHRRGTAGVTHVDPLHVRPEVEIVDQVRVEARAEATGAGGRRQEVDGGDVEVRPLEAAPNRLRGERHASLTKARGQLVHRLRTRIGGVEVEVPGVARAVEEERAAE